MNTGNNFKLSFFEPTSPGGLVKCTIHKDGKLGFSREAIKIMNIDVGGSVKIAKNTADASDESLYLVVFSSAVEGAFKIVKAGQYFYLYTKHLFDRLHIDYADQHKVIYDIEELDMQGQKVFKLNRRIKSRKVKQQKSEA